MAELERPYVKRRGDVVNLRCTCGETVSLLAKDIKVETRDHGLQPLVKVGLRYVGGFFRTQSWRDRGSKS